MKYRAQFHDTNDTNELVLGMPDVRQHPMREIKRHAMQRTKTNPEQRHPPIKHRLLTKTVFS